MRLADESSGDISITTNGSSSQLGYLILLRETSSERGADLIVKRKYQRRQKCSPSILCVYSLHEANGGRVVS
jgi:hypothetical protein